MEKSSPTSDKPDWETPLADLRKALEDLTAKVTKAVPMDRFQYVDVVFPAARVETTIKHDLRPRYPEDIGWIPVQWTCASVPAEPPYLYKDGVRPWTKDAILLKCNISNARVRLLLFVAT